jgi:cysteinyl-tRNA synthetase
VTLGAIIQWRINVKMVLKVYNTLTRCLEIFKPLHGMKVEMFVCGQTVQDDAHMGHAKTYVQFDIIVRWLRHLGYDVFYVQNITDVDDKIINRAEERGMDPLKLSEYYAQRYLDALEALGVKKNVTMFPRTTEYLEQMIEQIKILIEKGYAYVVDGDIYYDVAKFKDYTKLSRMPIKELKKHRVEPDPRKKNPFDFSLWKKQKLGELAWDSPWGRGRPGWHIEDTAMTWMIFGQQYDLHGGATELIFPHHTNEIAQAEAASGKKPFVKYWLHTGVLQIGGVEMHKSLGNFITIAEMLSRYDPEVIRLYYASTHYRKPIEFDEKDFEQPKRELEYFYNTIRSIRNAASDEGQKPAELKKALTETRKHFAEAMNDDFNTPLALAHLHSFAREFNAFAAKVRISTKLAEEAVNTMKDLGNILGFLEKEPPAEEKLPQEIEELIEQRQEARAKKDWRQADAIREKIRKMGYVLEDTLEGPRLRKAKTTSKRK